MRAKQKIQVMDDYESDASDLSLGDVGYLESSFSTSHNSSMMRRRYGQLGQAAIYQCARNNDIEGMNRMLNDPDVIRHINDLNEDGLSALHYAARFNHLQIVKLLVEYGKADPMVRDEEGATPLHYCARKKQQDDAKDDLVKIIQFLVVQSDVNARDNYNSTPLHFAAVRGNLVAARELLSCKETLVNAKDQLGCTPLHDAATYGHLHVAELLIKHGARLLHVDKDMCTALHSACYEGNHEIVQLLVDKCEPKKRSQMVNMKDDEDIQAIHYAIEAKCEKTVEILLQNGADADEPCRSKTTSRTPLHLAAIEDEPDIGALLLKHGARLAPRDINYSTPLHLAAEYECLNMVKTLLKEVKTPVDLTDKDNYTPLLCAVCMPSRDVVKALVEEGANLRATEKMEQNVIHLAAHCQQEKVLRYLLRHIKGTPEAYLINAQDRYGNSPLHLAAQVGNLDIVKMLLDNGADLFCKNEDEETPSLIASGLGKCHVIEEFLKRDEKILNDEDEYSNTALHDAAENGHFSVVKMLCEYGADKLNRNITYRVPLDLAAMNGHADIVEYFLDEDMPPEPADKDTETPLQLACTNGHDRVVAILLAKGADVTKRNELGKCCLTTAIERGHRAVVQEILTSSKWKAALSAESIYDWEHPRQTPLRHLVRKMPDITPLALNKSIKKGPEGTAETSKDFYLEFNLEMLDDTYSTYGKRYCSVFEEELTEEQLLPPKSARPYTTDLNWVKTNHLLSLMVSKKQADLLDHPAVLALIREKWSVGRLFYFLFLMYYALFLSFVTSFMVASTPPYAVSSNLSEVNCPVDDSELLDVTRILIWIFAAIGLIIEIFQLVSTSFLYFQEPINLVDWFCYVTACIIVADANDCGLRERWQWELGAFTVLGVWLNFLLFFRRFPALGIYVVMVTEILKTFGRIFIIFFLFIIAFGLSFHMLLQNQTPFAEPFDSIMKSWVMMLGEFEFTSIFFDEEALPFYEAVTYAIFIIFLIVMGIILSNLLTGLAVDDVNQLRLDARVVKLRMQIDLALDVEMALPEVLRRYFECNKRRARIYPNRYEGLLLRMSQKLTAWMEGPFLSERTIIQAVAGLDEEQLPTLSAVHEKLNKRISKNQEDLELVHQKLDRIEKMLIHLCGGRVGKDSKAPPTRTLSSILGLPAPKEKDSDDD